MNAKIELYHHTTIYTYNYKISPFQFHAFHHFISYYTQFSQVFNFNWLEPISQFTSLVI